MKFGAGLTPRGLAKSWAPFVNQLVITAFMGRYCLDGQLNRHSYFQRGLLTLDNLGKNLRAGGQFHLPEYVGHFAGPPSRRDADDGIAE